MKTENSYTAGAKLSEESVFGQNYSPVYINGGDWSVNIQIDPEPKIEINGSVPDLAEFTKKFRHTPVALYVIEALYALIKTIEKERNND